METKALRMSYFKLSNKLKYKLKSLPRGSNSSKPITNKCTIPYNHVTIDTEADCFLCYCDGFLPIPAGNVMDFDTIGDMFNSKIANIIQQDVSDNKFTWCAVEHCGIARFDRTQYERELIDYKYYISLNLEESCNLACPSCRREQIMITSGEEFDRKLQVTRQLLKWLEQETQPILLTMTGNGDPLASRILRPIVKEWKFPQHKIELKTNGLLAKKQLTNTNFLDNIARFSISIDAGSKAVYENVRRPGKWEALVENLEFIHSTGVTTWYNFVLQRNNYRDLENFYNLCERYNARPIILPMSDWGTWVREPTQDTQDFWTVENGFYVDQDILNPGNPEYISCKQTIQSLIDRNVITRLPPLIVKQLDLDI
jgi:pyruvate-formate lyase-activating enzyme